MAFELSILIPVYNQPVGALVQALRQEATSLPGPVEILVFDDGSAQATKDQNRHLIGLSGVIYQELSQNVGRSQIRHLLAQAATYPHLLFLDSDVLPVHPDFLRRYLEQPAEAVVVGGVSYAEERPSAGTSLRWVYGKAREEAPAAVRQKFPYERVFASNLLVPRALFLEHFPKLEITGYGYEDTLFAWRLQNQHIPVKHLENPVWHLGVEPNEVYLLKTQQALQNLVVLHQRFQVGENSRLFQAYHALERKGLSRWLVKSKQWLFPILQRNLTSQYPNLWFFDLYRLLLLAQYLRR
ncbi:glycosyltransferase family 2 protein [Rufibacter glacialis]|uniref:Glycosyltransferase family 2 protein n=1 Tax=Rufibacter glacialis TaxID=1259555 RepID=A0A5M8QHJ7_9BACT|nr:glycosyltransferase family 2 protein [Rufibacter glacialis]KAA6434621.1 glycosyltransferase family 2 protein [Rufibacter glacialis]GGK71104.1 glycosyl transferase [Rufibacter glacialis]